MLALSSEERGRHMHKHKQEDIVFVRHLLYHRVEESWHRELSEITILRVRMSLCLCLCLSAYAYAYSYALVETRLLSCLS